MLEIFAFASTIISFNSAEYPNCNKKEKFSLNGINIAVSIDRKKGENSMIDHLYDIEIKVVLADDHEVVRAGLRRVLSIDKSIKILDEASNGIAAIEMIKYHMPDIALLDILMPEMDGIEAAKIIKRTLPEVLVVMLTAFEDSLHLEQAMKAGADGYLSKDISAKDLIKALHDIYMGERVFSKSIVRLLQKQYVSAGTPEEEPITISKREQEILNFVALGKTSPEIADILNISTRTVQSHRSNVMQKLGIKNAGELVRYAVIHHTESNI